MELVCKLTQGKPPFLGILFEDAEAASVNSDLAVKYLKCDNLRLSIHSNYGRLFIYLTYGEKETIYYYRAVEYKGDEFELWRAYNHLGVNFGHCYKQDGQLKVPRLLPDQLYVLKISKFEYY